MYFSKSNFLIYDKINHKHIYNQATTNYELLLTTYNYPGITLISPW